MCSKISAFREGFFTFVTFIRLLPGMPSHVNLESAGSHELIITDVTNVGSFSGMSSLVIGKVTLCCKVHVAICKITSEGLLSVMYSHVGE